ncbi:hypothetical protein [Cysteiniphilum marinum]|uniref:hypothetical protein n=1 Tax=Cysteiniphilum marinum TaxID=2774191 RepID=UPI00193BB24D|nr:hypothetical protein [Cysteiniphilum marinum]
MANERDIKPVGLCNPKPLKEAYNKVNAVDIAESLSTNLFFRTSNGIGKSITIQDKLALLGKLYGKS